MAIVKGGHPNFGEILGIVMADTVRPRVPGDPGNASTFKYPVRYLVVEGSTSEIFVEGQAKGLLEPFMEAAKELEKQGVRAITTSCGLLAPFQEPMANLVDIPTFTSCLLQIPVILRMLRKDRKVAVVGLLSTRLTPDVFKAAGVDDMSRIVVLGTENTEYLFDSTRQPEFDPEQQCEELVNLVQEAIEENPEIGAVVLECSSFPAYGPAIQRATNLPVFDLITMANWVESAVNRKDFDGFM